MAPMVRKQSRKNAEREPKVKAPNGFIPIAGAAPTNSVGCDKYPQWDFAYWRIRTGRVERLQCACGGRIEFCWHVYETVEDAPRGRRMKAVFHMRCPNCGSSESEEQFVPVWAEQKDWPRI